MARRIQAVPDSPPATSPLPPLPAWRRHLHAAFLPALLLVALAFAAHLPALDAGFVWDDDVYVTENPHLGDTAGLSALWFQPGATKMYVPLVFTTFWVEHHLWGTQPLGYHAVNLTLHALGVLLLWRLLRRLRLPGAWFAAALFAVHPVFVESVAWVTELKNTQSTLFGLLALHAMLDFFALPDPGTAREPPARGSRGRYALALACFAAALLSKPVVVALPFVILLLVWWRRGRIDRRDVIALLPMLALSLAAGLGAMEIERVYGGAQGENWQLPLLERLLVAGRAFWFYLAKLFWPMGLVPIYPRWQIDAAAASSYVFPLAAAALVAALWLARRRIGRGPFVAVTSFALLIAPLVGIFNVSYHLHSYVADHFQHHGAPALLALVAACAALAARRLALPRAATAAAAGLLLCGLAFLSYRHARNFRDEETRCRATLAANPRAWLAMNNLGVALNREERFAEAAGWLERAVLARAPYPEAQTNLGVALVGLGKPLAAIEQYRAALRVWPDYPLAHNNLGTALAGIGQLEAARAEFKTALRLRPDFPAARANLERLPMPAAAAADAASAHNALGAALAHEQRTAEALREFAEAVRLRPELAEAHSNLGTALAAQGDLAGALREFATAVRLAPDAPEGRRNLGLALLSAGQTAEAVAQLTEAARLSPLDATTQVMLGVGLARLARFAEARDRFTAALELDPENVDARENLARAEAALRQR
jgi:tetratricopeptide (TPR) repeat protein